MSKAFAPLLRHGARRGLPSKAGFSRGAGPTGGLSRRDALRVGAGGLAGALLAPLGGCASRSRGRKSAVAAPVARGPRTVIVIGAGFGGLACADTLAHGGVNVVLLEASGRPGGRVRTDRAFIPGDSVELGGEWIGTNHPTWLEYAQEFNLRLEEPGSAPEPSGVGDAGPEGAATGEEGGAPPAESGAPGEGTPKPVPFETEMDPPGEGQGGAPQAGGRMKALFASMVSQPADSAEPVPADERQPTEPPAEAGVAPVDRPPEGGDAAGQPGARPPNQPATDPSEADEPLILNGKLLRGGEADKLYEEVDAVLAKLIDLAKDVDPIRPYASPGAAELDARSFASFIEEQQGLGQEARALLIHGAEADNGVSADRMSLLGFLSMIAGGGFQDYFELSETYRLADGNDALATALAQKLGPRVQFNAMVDAVRRTADGVVVRMRGGQYYRGDAVVLATPPSVWDKIEFTPPLDEAFAPQMGNNVKLLLSLREAVWERQGLTADVTSVDTRPPADLPRPATVRQWMGLTWASTEAPGGRGPVGLTLFAGAGEAEEMRHLPPLERNVWAYTSLEPAYPRLREQVVRERFVDWTGFPLTRASYSFPAPGQVTAFGPALVEGIGGGLAPLMFAGEHTAYGFIGYMEGALSSGVRVGRLLLGTEPRETAQQAPAETQPAETQPTDPVTGETPPEQAAPQEAQPAPEGAPDAAPEPAEVPQPA